MNLREGPRRLGLLLGFAGALISGVASYAKTQEILAHRTLHNNFEAVATSGQVQTLRKDHYGSKEEWEGGKEKWVDTSVNPGCCGVRKIVWDNDRVWKDGSGIYSIETDSGDELYPAPAPRAWEYLLIPLFPILGFLSPWGTIRAIGWVAAGFAQSPN